ncbi:MAG: 4Fe-4S dicluster domain-containing protein [Promethearchaeota archaeon]|nr:MAG: 4Fe-4S dicluster domain-containing protein [Candidatus Lokiarchaeota archaeon]
MSEKLWQKAAKILVRASGNPLFQANDTMIELLKTLLNEEQAKFLFNFRNPILTLEKLKEKTGMEENDLKVMLNSLMDEGFIFDKPNDESGIMEYHLLAPIPDIFEYSLVKKGSTEKRKKLAKIYDRMIVEASKITQENYETIMPIFKDEMPPFTRILPIDEELVVPQEKTLPTDEASKIIDKNDIISLSRCPCKFQRELLGDPCKATENQFRCIHLGHFGRYFIEHGFGKQISKEEAKKVLLEAAQDGLVHKTFHYDWDIDKEENCICNCCKCCCIIFQSYYRGVWPFHTQTSYIAEVDESKCEGCGTCIEKCPIEALSLIEGKSYLDENKCIGCGVCVQQCPEGAITLRKTELRRVFIPTPKVDVYD